MPSLSFASWFAPRASVSRPAGALPGTWRLPMLPALGWAIGVAWLLSLQFLTQDWVWDNWPVSEVVWAWAHQLRDRVVVALAIVLAAWSAGRLPVASLRGRALLLAAAMVTGALAGELVLRAIDDTPRRGLYNAAVSWALVSLCVAGMFYLWRDSAELHARWQADTLKRLQAQQQLADAQRVALKNQIEPHFLFNTLATVRWLQRTEPAAGAAMLADFIDYLRRALPMLDSPQVPLSQELALLRAYLAVIAVRMKGRLQVEIEVPAAIKRVPLPPLVLATLVENAIKHGLSPAPEGGALRIAATLCAHTGPRSLLPGQPWIEIVVEDTGVGFAAGSTSGSGIGLSNARARLRNLYGDAAGLRLEAVQPSGVRAIVTLPVAWRERP